MIAYNTDEYMTAEYVLNSFARAEFIIAEKRDFIEKTRRNNLTDAHTQKLLESAQRELSKATKRQQAVLNTIQNLTTKENIVFYSYYVHHLTINETAAVLGISRRQTKYIKKAIVNKCYNECKALDIC